MVSKLKAFLSGTALSVLSASTLSVIALPTAFTSAAHAQMSDAVDPDVMAPEAVSPEVESQPTDDTPTVTRAVEQANSPIGIAAGQSLMGEAEVAIRDQNYSLAAAKLIEARQALNEVSTHYQGLSSVFVGLDSRVNQDLRSLALESAQVRDQASYQLAVVYRAQNRPDLAVPLLVEVVKSQQPTRGLGQQAYQQLYELGFVGVSYNSPS